MTFGIELGKTTVLSIDGKDRHRILNNVATQDLRALATGTVRETFITEGKGRTYGHGLVFGCAESLLYLTVPNQAERITTHIDRFIIREDVSIVDQSDQWHVWLFTTWANACEAFEISKEMSACEPGSFIALDLPDSTPWIATPSPWTGGDTMLVLFRSDTLSEQMKQRHQSHWVASDFETRAHWETLRIANFWPWYGVDFDERNLPQELARDDLAISFRKGCYLGQETVARLDALGQVQKKLVLLEIEGSEAIALQTSVTADGTQVGTVTSSANGPNHQMAFAFVKRSHFKVGQRLEVAGRVASVVR